MSRQCQQIGVDIEQTMQHGQEFERNFGKKMCRLAMFVSLAQFISIEMKKILKEYAKGIIPRAFVVFLGVRLPFKLLQMVLVRAQQQLLLWYNENVKPN
ncbi:hypothetical protein niasHS_001153 [Heterodera schachtii]|uniref:Uncharacterized protein n=1 Tax=Heterodera schachtii TaxID=97005 RepID=A0ABD2KCP0_HETSC